MKRLCNLKAPAKLNLHLQVGNRRSDGFHDIKSLFVMVDLYDEINIRSLTTSNNCRITGKFNCDVEDNLIYKAWKKFCNEAGMTFGVEFLVNKKIPSFAGLGGGSSDAAAALKAMNTLFRVFSDEKLAEIGAAIGSDVPFFLSSPAAVISGRGDITEGLADIRELHFVLIHPGLEISTREAYGWIDEQGLRNVKFLSNDDICSIYNGELSDFNIFNNDFFEVLSAGYEDFSVIINDLNKVGAVFSNVTGSGSAVFGLFQSPEDAEKAENELKNRYKFVQKIKSLDRIPYAILE